MRHREREKIEDAADCLRTEDVTEEERIVEFQHLILDVLLDIRDLLKPTQISVVDQGGILPTSTYDIE